MNHVKKNCLITGGGGVGNQLIYKILNKSYNLYFSDCAPENIHPDIPAANRVKIDNANSINFLKSLNQVCEEKNINLIVPCVDEELLKIKELCSKNLYVVLPDLNFIKTMLNKYEASHDMTANGLNTPITLSYDEFLESNVLRTPFVVKPTSGRGSRDVYIASRSEQVQAIFSLTSRSPRDFIFQEFIDGAEYTISMISDQFGELKYIYPMRVIEKKGVTIKAVYEKNEKILEICKKFHSVYKPSGVVNIQIINGLEGPRIIEVNPRASTTLCAAIQSGIDPIAVFLQMDKSKVIPKPVSLERYFNNYVSWGVK